MKLKTLNKIVTVLAIIGIFCILGVAGNADYGAEIGESFSMGSAVKQLIIGGILILPAVIREVF